MKKRKLTWGLLSLSLAVAMGSCSKEDNSSAVAGGDGQVQVESMNYAFDDVNYDSSNDSKSIAENAGGKVVSTVETPLEGGYTLVGELIEAGNVDTRSAVNIGIAKAITFYDNADKAANGVRNQAITPGSTLLVPRDGATIVFYAYESGVPANTLADHISSPKNVCWSKQHFTGSESSTTLSFQPLFSQITSFKVENMTSGGETVASVSNVKLIAGSQSTADITIAKEGVSYTKTNVDAEVPVLSAAPGSEQSQAVDFIPNNNSMKLEMTVTIGSETRTGTIDFKEVADISKRYVISVTVQKPKSAYYTIKFVSNTSGLLSQPILYNTAADATFTTGTITNGWSANTDLATTWVQIIPNIIQEGIGTWSILSWTRPDGTKIKVMGATSPVTAADYIINLDGTLFCKPSSFNGGTWTADCVYFGCLVLE